jgi:Protein of unknown function (DUF3455)
MNFTIPPDTRSSQRSALVTAASVVLALTIGSSRAEAQVIPPLVPANLEVEFGNTPFLVGHAIGTQNYVCLLRAGGFAWTFFGPQATLFDDDGQQLTTHFLSANPDENGTLRATWQHSQDTSAIWALAIASSTDPAYVLPGAIPWLLLRVVGVEAGPTGGATLSATTFVQRVNTSGGIAPAADGCARAADVGRRALVPYTADYVFYRN